MTGATEDLARLWNDLVDRMTPVAEGALQPVDTSDPGDPPTSVKVVIAGSSGAGKTALVGAVSEIEPLRAEERLTVAAAGDPSGTGSTTATVAVDLGRITIRDDLIFYLFEAPDQDRSWFVRDELAPRALGAVVLADPRRLPGCRPAVDLFARRRLPFVVGVNRFDGGADPDRDDAYDPLEDGFLGRSEVAGIRLALGLDPDVPVLRCDPRSRRSSKGLLVTLVAHAIRLRRTELSAT
jgi:signal recognition particle receptor subunit beta